MLIQCEFLGGALDGAVLAVDWRESKLAIQAAPGRTAIYTWQTMHKPDKTLKELFMFEGWHAMMPTHVIHNSHVVPVVGEIA
jgi:hypothetical protein